MIKCSHCILEHWKKAEFDKIGANSVTVFGINGIQSGFEKIGENSVTKLRNNGKGFV